MAEYRRLRCRSVSRVCHRHPCARMTAFTQDRLQQVERFDERRRVVVVLESFTGVNHFGVICFGTRRRFRRWFALRCKTRWQRLRCSFLGLSVSCFTSIGSHSKSSGEALRIVSTYRQPLLPKLGNVISLLTFIQSTVCFMRGTGDRPPAWVLPTDHAPYSFNAVVTPC
jgi:hypothetical protein